MEANEYPAIETFIRLPRRRLKRAALWRRKNALNKQKRRFLSIIFSKNGWLRGKNRPAPTMKITP